MKKRLQAYMHTCQALSAVIESRLSAPDARANLMKLAKRLIVDICEASLMISTLIAGEFGEGEAHGDFPPAVPGSVLLSRSEVDDGVARRIERQSPGLARGVVRTVPVGFPGSPFA